MSAGEALSNLQAYEQWAASYPPVPHNPLMRAEQAAMLRLWPSGAGARALDLACGSGRYAALAAQRGASEVTAVDFSPAMLARVRDAARVRASMMRLPFADAVFDWVVCGLAVGHAPALAPWMREMARVLRAGGVLLYSDFHPAAAGAGMTRSFIDAQQRRHVLRHRRYALAAHHTTVAAAGLTVEATHELKVGEGLSETFSGSAEFYRRWQGLPVVLVVRARKAMP